MPNGQITALCGARFFAYLIDMSWSLCSGRFVLYAARLFIHRFSSILFVVLIMEKDPDGKLSD